MKLVLQIPCYNEQDSLPVTLAALPREVPGIDEVEWVVIDDGSSDRTAAVAAEHGADEVVRHCQNLGLARAFMTGLATSLERGADVIVNLDADNQYCAEDVPRLIEPILAHRADMVIGTRPIGSIAHFSWIKKWLQRLGSWVVRKSSGMAVEDAPSGFRAFSREAALRMNVFSRYTYTLETIIQAGQIGIAVESVPVHVNEQLRPSRLVKSIPSYVARSIGTIVRIFVTYRPFRTFLALGAVLMLAGAVLGVRFLYHYVTSGGGGMVQSLILAAVLMLMGFQLGLLGLLADLVSVNRKLLEDVQFRLRRMDLTASIEAATRPRMRTLGSEPRDPAELPEAEPSGGLARAELLAGTASPERVRR